MPNVLTEPLLPPSAVAEDGSPVNETNDRESTVILATGSPPTLPYSESANDQLRASTRLSIISEVELGNGIVIRVVSNGATYFLQAVNTIGNSIIFALPIIDLVEVATLTSAFQSFARNVFSGMLNASGQMLSSARSDNDPKQIRELAIASYSLTALWSFVSAVLYVGAYFGCPYTGYSQRTIEGTRDFLFYTGFAIWPTLALTTLGQVAYASGFWKSSLTTSLLNRIPAIIGSYFLVKYLDLGTSGIAIANTAAPWLVYLGMEFWIRRQPEFNDIFTSSTVDVERPEYNAIKKQFNAMFWLSLKVGFQRCVEWLNALVITLLLGALDKESLRAMNPSLNAIALWSLFSQGIGTAGNMYVARYIKSLERARERNQPEEDQAIIYAHIKSVIIKSVFAGVLINAIVAGGMYAAREPIVDWFIDHPSMQTKRDAEVLLGVVGLGLVADAPRLIVSTILTAFNKPIMPNLVSLVLMSMGIGGSYFLSIDKDDSFSIISMFVFRSATILLAALINLYTTYQSVVGLFAVIDEKIEQKRITRETAAREAESTRVVVVPSESESAKPNCLVRVFCSFWSVRHGELQINASPQHPVAR